MKTCWKRRSSAGSFSIRSRYSSRVVAPIMCSSPRASIGLSMLPASIAESPPAPAPTTVCSSSMKVMICPPASLISSSTDLSRSSNSPRYFAPATIAARSSESTRRPLRESGTSPATTRWARPSTTAVLPTPGSPISTGLFLVRRLSTWMTRRISASRPMTGSSRPSRLPLSGRRRTSPATRTSTPRPRWSPGGCRAPRRCPRAGRRRSGRRRRAPAWPRTPRSASATSRWSVATYSSFMPVARSIAVASTRVSAAEAAGRWTVAPVALGQRPQRGLGGGGQRGDVDAGLGDQAAGGAVLLAQQRDQEVDRLGGVVPGRRRGHLGDLDGLPAAGGELFGSELTHTDCRSLVSCGLVWMDHPGPASRTGRPLAQRSGS